MREIHSKYQLLKLSAPCVFMLITSCDEVSLSKRTVSETEQNEVQNANEDAMRHSEKNSVNEDALKLIASQMVYSEIGTTDEQLASYIASPDINELISGKVVYLKETYDSNSDGIMSNFEYQSLVEIRMEELKKTIDEEETENYLALYNEECTAQNCTSGKTKRWENRLSSLKSELTLYESATNDSTKEKNFTIDPQKLREHIELIQNKIKEHIEAIKKELGNPIDIGKIIDRANNHRAMVCQKVLEHINQISANTPPTWLKKLLEKCGQP